MQSFIVSDWVWLCVSLCVWLCAEVSAGRKMCFSNVNPAGTYIKALYRAVIHTAHKVPHFTSGVATFRPSFLTCTMGLIMVMLMVLTIMYQALTVCQAHNEPTCKSFSCILYIILAIT